MPSWLRVIAGRIIGALAAGFVGWILAKLGIELAPEDRNAVADSVVAAGMTIVLIAYSLVHKIVDRKVNPGDTASGRLAEMAKVQREHLPPTN